MQICEVIHKPFIAIVSIRHHLFNVSIHHAQKVQMERERVRKLLPVGLLGSVFLPHRPKIWHTIWNKNNPA